MKLYHFVVLALILVLVDGHRRYKGYSRRHLRQPFIPHMYPDGLMNFPLNYQYRPNIPQIPVLQPPISQFPQQLPQQFAQQFPQIPFIPQIPQQFPGLPVLREFVQSGDKKAGAMKTGSISGNCQTNGCPIGQFCVLEDQIKQDFYLCTTFMKESCQCVQGCKHKMTFIPYGQSREIDTCRSKCTCNSIYGTPECDKKSCFNTPIKMTKK